MVSFFWALFNIVSCPCITPGFSAALLCYVSHHLPVYIPCFSLPIIELFVVWTLFHFIPCFESWVDFLILNYVGSLVLRGFACELLFGSGLQNNSVQLKQFIRILQLMSCPWKTLNKNKQTKLNDENTLMPGLWAAFIRNSDLSVFLYFCEHFYITKWAKILFPTFHSEDTQAHSWIV